MSALSPSATWQMVSPVAGLIVGNVFPDELSTHLPPMNIGWSLTLGGLTVRGFSAVAVAMCVFSWHRKGEDREPVLGGSQTGWIVSLWTALVNRRAASRN